MKLIAPHPEPKTTMVFFGSIAHDSPTTSVLADNCSKFFQSLVPVRVFFSRSEDAEKFASLSRDTSGVAGVPIVSFIQKTTPRPNAFRGHLRRSPEGGKKDMTAECRPPFWNAFLESSRRRRQKNVDAFISRHNLPSSVFSPIFQLKKCQKRKKEIV